MFVAAHEQVWITADGGRTYGLRSRVFTTNVFAHAHTHAHTRAGSHTRTPLGTVTPRR